MLQLPIATMLAMPVGGRDHAPRRSHGGVGWEPAVTCPEEVATAAVAECTHRDGDSTLSERCCPTMTLSGPTG